MGLHLLQRLGITERTFDKPPAPLAPAPVAAAAVLPPPTTSADASIAATAATAAAAKQRKLAAAGNTLLTPPATATGVATPLLQPKTLLGA
jgi:hypothetical protein